MRSGGTDMYRFHQVADIERTWGTSRLMLSPSSKEAEIEAGGRLGVYQAFFRGALLQLFGEPLVSGGDSAYDYVLEATDDEGNSWTLTAYEGSGGAAIGGNSRDPSIIPVAIALRELIEQTPPADFEDTAFDDEYGTTRTYGCKDGVCYYYEARGRVARATTNLIEVERQEQQEREARLLAENPNCCLNCEGSGKCRGCDGTGRMKSYSGFDDAGKPMEVDLPFTDEAAVVCVMCAGTGDCPVCNGTGTIE
jgi:hypothetical protein